MDNQLIYKGNFGTLQAYVNDAEKADKDHLLDA